MEVIKRNAVVGDEILVLKHNFSVCKGIRKVIEIEDNIAYFNVKAPCSFNSKGWEIVKCGTPLDRFERYNGDPAYVVLK